MSQECFELMHPTLLKDLDNYPILKEDFALRRKVAAVIDILVRVHPRRFCSKVQHQGSEYHVVVNCDCSAA
jgi:hypothetical protein